MRLSIRNIIPRPFSIPLVGLWLTFFHLQICKSANLIFLEFVTYVVASALLLIRTFPGPITAKATAVANAMPNVAKEKRSSKKNTMTCKNFYLLGFLYTQTYPYDPRRGFWGIITSCGYPRQWMYHPREPPTVDIVYDYTLNKFATNLRE